MNGKISKTQSIGYRGEDIAADYLKKKGCRIIARNFRCRSGELDLVAIGEGRLIFAEVKTRSSAVCGRPAVFVDGKKQQRIYKAAYYFLMCRPQLKTLQPRMDIIEILLTDGRCSINHIKNAF